MTLNKCFNTLLHNMKAHTSLMYFSLTEKIGSNLNLRLSFTSVSFKLCLSVMTRLAHGHERVAEEPNRCNSGEVIELSCCFR